MDIPLEVESTIKKQMQRFNIVASERLLNKPKLPVYSLMFLDAFYELDTERSSLEPIPWSSIVKYSDYYNFSKELGEDLLYVIRQMDNAYIKHIADKQKKERHK